MEEIFLAKGCTFYFVRHGRTFFNEYMRMQGWSDTPLTRDGVFEVRQSARGLSEVKFSAAYCSDLSRTKETTEIFLEENYHSRKLPITEMAEFREAFYGSFEGLDIAESWETIAHELGYKTAHEMREKATLADRMDGTKKADPRHDAEDFLTFWLRVEKGLLKLIDKHRDTGDHVLVVSHGNTIRNMLNGIVPELDVPTSLDNASISVVNYQNGQFHLESFNDTSHFR